MDSVLRSLIDLRDQQIQKARKQFGNRIDALMRDVDTDESGHQRELLVRYYEHFVELEASIDDDIAELVEEYEIYEHVSAVRGVGPILAAKLVAMIDVTRSPTVSSLWRYAGYGMAKYWQNRAGKIVAPVTGYKWNESAGEWVRHSPKPDPSWTCVTVSDRLIKGYRSPYNRRLKVTLYVIATSFLRSGSPYRDEYDDAKEYYLANRDWTKGHCHAAARRKMIKLFLSHYWQRARELKGLETPDPYALARMGHTGMKWPEQYGWPAIDN